MFKQKKCLFFVLTALIIVSQVVIPIFSAQAQAVVSEFDPSFIITDDDLLDYDALDLKQIQTFLKDKGGKLADYKDPITGLPAPEIIYKTAQDFLISPKFLLTLLQKEQSLVENPRASTYNFDWATGYAVCDGCDINDPFIQKFKGFYNQVYNVGKRIRNDYLTQLENNGRTISGIGPNITKNIDGVPLAPKNRATAILYTYTPHFKGNKLFWVLWNRYFSQIYPDGSLLNVENDKYVWLIQNGVRRKFANRRVYLSRYPDFNKLLTVTESELLKYQLGNEIKFPNYSYLKTPTGTVYLVVDDTVRKFTTPQALRKIGVNPEEIIKITDEDLIGYAEGEPITTKSVYPLGAILQDKTTKQIYLVQNNMRHTIASRELLQANFPGRKPLIVPSKQIKTYELDVPIIFRDGELVRAKTDNTIYLISNKQRRPFASLSALKSLGYEEKNIITTADEAVLIHELGVPIASPI